MARACNNVSLAGRIASISDIKTYGDNFVLSFSIAIKRPKFGDKEPETDFISCEVWGKRAEIISKFFNKGDGIEVLGEIRTSSSDGADGTKRYFTKVNVSDFSFPCGKKSGYSEHSADEAFDSSGTLDISSDDLPY